ncbi:MAG: hypothetical protein ACR2HX_16730 [Pyrinomonadaceae bacterium]
MKKFDIYLKKGEMLSVNCDLEPQGSKYILKNNSSDEGFILLDRIAAIIPETERDATPDDKSRAPFLVYLKRHNKAAKIYAYALETDPQVVFKTRKQKLESEGGFGGGVSYPEKKIENIYIDPSQIVGILRESFLATSELKH